jgi:thioredoxin reductase
MIGTGALRENAGANAQSTSSLYDVVIVGAGPAGLSAGLILGRCRRTVLICDSGRPRNAASHALHGYLTRDGIDPRDFRSIGRRELKRYETVHLTDIAVADATCDKDGRFAVTLADGSIVQSRKLLVATGVCDNLPQIDGFEEMYGRSVFHCPYCDGWEARDQPLAIYGQGARGVGLSLELTAWSRDLVLCTDGRAEISTDDRERLTRNGIRIREERVIALEGHAGMLQRIRFETGESLARSAIFFTTGQFQRSELAVRLGCEVNDKGTVRTGKYESTHLPGLYVAGDASRAVQWVIVAAAEGAEAAFSINTDLIKEDLK